MVGCAFWDPKGYLYRFFHAIGGGHLHLFGAATTKTLTELKQQQGFKSLLWALLAFLGAMGIQYVLQGIWAPGRTTMVLWGYGANLIMAGGIVALLFVFRKRFRDQMGFLFMLGSLLKFGIFFLFFYPIYHADGKVDKVEFASFFIPYAIALVLETVYTSRMLQKIQ